MKRKIRLTEGDLHKIVKESVNRILNEIGDTAKGQYMLGKLQRRDGKKTWKGSWAAEDARTDAAEKKHQEGGSYDATYNNLLRAYRDGLNGRQW